MKASNKKRRPAKEIRRDMLKINNRKASHKELVDLVNIINENADPEVERIVGRREDNGIEPTWN